MTRSINGLAELSPAYDGFLVDVWGVLIDGRRAFPEAYECLTRLRAAGRPVALISNTSRSAENLSAMLADMGIPPGAYHALVTSGELTRRALASPDADHGWRRYLHLGSRENTEWLATTNLTEADSVEEADVIIATGVIPEATTTAELGGILATAADRKLVLICANPDREVLVGDQRLVAVGTLGDAYTSLGGEVEWYGKPELPIYQFCLSLPAFAGTTRVVAVGDSVATDIAGATAAGLDTVLVKATGIHRAWPPVGAVPTYSVQHFVW